MKKQTMTSASLNHGPLMDQQLIVQKQEIIAPPWATGGSDVKRKRAEICQN